jgi:hypothetical protein
MSTTSGGPNIVTNGLVMYLDAANTQSYSGTGTAWNDLTVNGNNGTLTNGPTFSTIRNGAIVFDGTDDYSRPNISHSYLSSSSLEVIFNSFVHNVDTGGGNKRKTIFGYRHNSGYYYPTIGSIFLGGSNGDTLLASVITSTQAYVTATFSSTILTNTVYHVVLNKDTTNGILQLFVNGIAGVSQSFDASTYATYGGSGLLGANILDIGKSTNGSTGQGWGSDYFNGHIYKLAVYNRILTQNEVLQNYNAQKSRFGLP